MSMRNYVMQITVSEISCDVSSCLILDPNSLYTSAMFDIGNSFCS